MAVPPTRIPNHLESERPCEVDELSIDRDCGAFTCTATTALVVKYDTISSSTINPSMPRTIARNTSERILNGVCSFTTRMCSPRKPSGVERPACPVRHALTHAPVCHEDERRHHTASHTVGDCS
jgi:hypothetical protein